ncbi:MAG: hypothetical protein F6J93_02815 [Oscillatoria sp. SIO1A7]|nr:hypothetical protein [Oscillatoria sp. SIO1A7]
MRNPTEIEKKQSARLQELTAIARQRYIEAGGDPKRCPSGRKGDDYMTDEERKEAIELMRQIAGDRIVGDRVSCQGRSWKVSKVPVQSVS